MLPLLHLPPSASVLSPLQSSLIVPQSTPQSTFVRGGEGGGFQLIETAQVKSCFYHLFRVISHHTVAKRISFLLSNETKEVLTYL
jgi:hypothetical protein